MPTLDELTNNQDLIKQLPELAVTYGTKIVLALVIFFAGKWLAKNLSNAFAKGLEKKGVDVTVSSFIRNISYYALFTVVIIAALGQMGIQTASFVAVLGAAGLAVGFALQGSLSNFAAGVLLILFRPFKVGDFVEAAGVSGIVSEISIFSTVLKTPDNKTVIVSNSSVMDNAITNYSTEAKRRVDFVVGISYDADLKLAQNELLELAKQEALILKDEDVTVGISELADSSVNIVFRVWVNTPDYWAVYFNLNEAIKLRFDELNIGIPYPQMDVHIAKND